jgi:hypothetical protein
MAPRSATASRALLPVRFSPRSRIRQLLEYATRCGGQVGHRARRASGGRQPFRGRVDPRAPASRAALIIGWDVDAPLEELAQLGALSCPGR